MLDRLPPELCVQVAQNLSAQDVLKLLMLHRSLAPLGNSELLWVKLMERDSHELPSENTATVQELKKAYLVYAHSTLLEQVRWRPVRSVGGPSPREGHLMCILGSPSNRKFILTGGFSDDHRAYLLPMHGQQQQWMPVAPRSLPSFVYGASLTPLDETRAVRFGGFRAGGYSGETNQVCLLRLDENDNSVDWETIETHGTPPMARAYHSATLAENRYLVILGGMTTRGSILQEAILDTQTWTWLDTNISNVMATGKPSGRHGHSVVLDSKRNRLVLFGGGSGSDLLRSGSDNTEVWELKMNGGTEDLPASLPWAWIKIYKDANEEDNGELPSAGKASDLSPAECLVLGRCHVGAKVSVDSVVLAFGSGTPTTNGILVYNLAADKFQRPTVRGPLPVPRFTAASAIVNKEGWLLIHGGYTTQVDGTRGDTVLLDLSPGVRRDFPSLRMLPDNDDQILTYREIHNGDAERARQRHQANDIGDMLVRLSDTDPDDRRDLANRFLADVINGGGMGGHVALILSMVANGTAVFGGEDDSGDEEGEYVDAEEDDDDEEEEMVL